MKPRAQPGNIIVFTRSSISEIRSGSAASFLHHRFVLLMNISGKGTVCIDDKHFPLESGQALLIFPYQVHFYLDLSGAPFEWLFITFESPHSQWFENLKFRIIHPNKRSWIIIQWLTEFWKNRPHPSGSAFLLGFLLEELRRSKGTSLKFQPGSGGILEQINQIIYQNLKAPWSIEELSQTLNISSSHLRASFRQQVGTSLGSYLQRIRINRAAAMIATSDKRISEIAEACGYDSIYSFSRAFKTKIGISPKKYRTSLTATPS